MPAFKSSGENVTPVSHHHSTRLWRRPRGFLALAFVVVLFFSAPLVRAHETAGSTPAQNPAVFTAMIAAQVLMEAAPRHADLACPTSSTHANHGACVDACVGACHTMIAGALFGAESPALSRTFKPGATAAFAGSDVAPLSHPPKV